MLPPEICGDGAPSDADDVDDADHVLRRRQRLPVERHLESRSDWSRASSSTSGESRPGRSRSSGRPSRRPRGGSGTRRSATSHRSRESRTTRPSSRSSAGRTGGSACCGGNSPTTSWRSPAALRLRIRARSRVTDRVAALVGRSHRRRRDGRRRRLVRRHRQRRLGARRRGRERVGHDAAVLVAVVAHADGRDRVGRKIGPRDVRAVLLPLVRQRRRARGRDRERHRMPRRRSAGSRGPA